MSLKPLDRLTTDEMPEPSKGRRGPTWNSIGLFIRSVFSVIALALLIGLGFAVVDAQKEIDFLKLRVENINRDLAYLRGRLDERKDVP